MNEISKETAPGEYREHAFTEEEFVLVKESERLEVQMQYPILGMRHAECDCLLRKSVYERLVLAASYLPEGMKLRIWDAWRPFALQRELYESYAAQLIREFNLEGLSEREKETRIATYVSLPVEDADFPPVHTTGGAVDVTLIDEKGQELDMGTAFDEFSEATETAFFENGSNPVVRDNRRLLYHVMKKAGFTNLPSEWWHYDFGERFWAFYKEQPAKYRGVFTREEIYEETDEKSRIQSGNTKKN